MSVADTNVDHYKVLGLDLKATPAEVRTAYRELSKKHHPDRGGDPDVFARITISYTVLSDSDARSMYDVERRLAASRAADEVRAANGEPSGAQAWATTVFGTETPSRPQRPGAPDAASQPTQPSTPTPSPQDYQEAQRATAEKLHYAAHRTVSYVIAAVVGGLWWPIQFLLAKSFPSTEGHPAYVVQQVIVRPGAPVLVIVLAALAVFCERRLFPVHTVRTTPSRLRRQTTSTAVVLILWLNVYLAQWPFAFGAIAVVALVAAAALVKKT